MALRERLIEYDCNGTTCEALLAWDDAAAGPQPGVLVAHAWAGRTEFEEDKARGLAAQGYVGMALDVYGKGVRGGDNDENAALMAPFMEDRGLLLARLQQALVTLREQPEVDAAHCAGIGYCFGGLCMLDLARAGTDLAGVVSVHGLFTAPENGRADGVRARVLCLHGYDDPMAPPQALLELAGEFSAAGADWQVHAYGGTLHAFTNPGANNPDFGTVYSPRADARATRSISNFLEELFADA